MPVAQLTEGHAGALGRVTPVSLSTLLTPDLSSSPQTLADPLLCLPAGPKETPGHPEESAHGSRAAPLTWMRVHTGSQPCGALA